MALTLSPAIIAMSSERTKVFSASGGTAPYTYSVAAAPGVPGAGGTIDAATGAYTPREGAVGQDIVTVTDSAAPPARARAAVMVGTPLNLIADILASELGLAPGRAWVYDQKVMEPTDNGLFVVVGVLTDKILASGVRYVDDGMGGLNEVKTANVVMTATVDIKSRDTSARDRRHEITTAINSTYSRQQQLANGFKIGPQPFSGPIDLSHVDGAAIPFWYQVQLRVHFLVTRTAPVGVYTSFQNPAVLIDQ